VVCEPMLETGLHTTGMTGGRKHLFFTTSNWTTISSMTGLWTLCKKMMIHNRVRISDLGLSERKRFLTGRTGKQLYVTCGMGKVGTLMCSIGTVLTAVGLCTEVALERKKVVLLTKLDRTVLSGTGARVKKIKRMGE